MKSFFKTVLAVIVGLFIASIIGFMLLATFLGALSSSAGSTASVPKTGILDINFSKISLGEQTIDDDAMISLNIGLSQETTKTIGIWDAIQAIEKAAGDPAIKFVYLRPDGVSGGMAEIEEFRKALEFCKKEGKPIISFIENPSNASYYLASASDKIYMGSYCGGMNSMVGISSQIVYLKDILDKLGINMQLIRHGKYKSAGETYIRNDISPENREQYEKLIGSVWSNFSSAIAQARNISTERFNGMIDNLELNMPQDFLDKGLVDSLVTREGLLKKICSLYGVGKPEDLKMVSLPDYAKSKLARSARGKDKIAVIYADGEIIDGKEKKEVAGDRFASIINDIRKDSTVKAVVFRVSSPGGSVVASEKIRTEIELLREEKPVIASYGNYAASGGYWISNSCDRVFSNANTLTGSIGVFSMIPDFSKTAKDLAHINVVNISSNRHSDMYSLTRPMDEDELAYMQASVEDIYDKFTSIVAEGRSMTVEAVDEIAQGRVWSGTDALGIGLVDEIGTIEDAIQYAATVANGTASSDLSKWDIVGYPKPLNTMEMLLDKVQEDNAKALFKGTALEDVEYALNAVRNTKMPQTWARMPFDITIR